MKRILSARFQNGAFRPLDAVDPSIPEGAIVAITVEDDPLWDDPKRMKRLLDDDEAKNYLNSVDREAAP